MKKVLVLTLAFVFLLTGVCSAGKSKLKKQDSMLADAEKKLLLLDYYERVVGTPAEQPYYEVVLYHYSDAEVLLEQYTAGGTPAEKVTAYRVPAKAYEKAMAKVRQWDMAGWYSRKDCFSMEGKRYVCKFRDGERLVRVSSDAMPEDGEAAFSAVRNVLAEYTKEKYRVSQ